jgi:secreted PhoX family phosphatase
VILSRREFIRSGSAAATRAVVGSSLFALACDVSFYGPLGPADENGIRLPPGFRSRVVARSGQRVGSSAYVWHEAPDGGAVFETHGGWVYVSNSERRNGGGVGALRFNPAGRLVDAYSICSGTRRNCAGGATPWGSWLSCEEVETGLVFECDPHGERAPVALPALGRFNHEAVAVDLEERRLYLTEDRSDGRLYRFTPHAWGSLAGGALEVAQVSAAGAVKWRALPDPLGNPLATRRQVPASTPFNGGEGIAYAEGHVYFTTKGDNRVWNFDVAGQTIDILYDRASDGIKQLGGVDNVTTTQAGRILVAEDGGNMELVMVNANGLALALLRVEGQPNSELTGPAFDPQGQRLYFSSQRGTQGRGITYEVRGPFASLRENALGNPGWSRRGRS